MFTFSTAQKVLLGNDSISKIADEVVRIGGRKVGILTDPGIIKVGLEKKLIESLENQNIKYGIFCDVEPEPSVQCAENAVNFARKGGYDCIVGYGGGSSLDVAKAVAVLLTNKGRLLDYLGKPESIQNPPGRFILCPTTAGTGSEVSNAAVFAVPEDRMKYVLYSSYLYPNVVILDPNLTKTMPQKITAQTGIDALCHAIEGYVSLKSTPLTEMFSEKAIKMISDNLRIAYTNGNNMKARENMLIASYIAGLSFGNAGTVLGHAVGYAYGFELHVPHGLSIGITMPYVLEYNAIADTEKHVKIASLMGEDIDTLTLREAAFKAASAFRNLLCDIGFPPSIREVGATEDMIPLFAENVFKSKSHVARNPRLVVKEDMVKLFKKAFEGRLTSESRN
ncbi:iron-containing alcohol dehydrogenase [[Eubacterium] cellulosolvens]